MANHAPHAKTRVTAEANVRAMEPAKEMENACVMLVTLGNIVKAVIGATILTRTNALNAMLAVISAPD